MVVRGRRPVRSVVLFALVVAATVYAGQAEVLTLLGLSLATFLVVLLVARQLRESVTAMWRPVRDL
ncbi:MAG TPA: hypothetical protein PK867_24950, partial [Pirellulales bacterium]|nr:hypothetical protein [Pirellulales bacterium]